jgi:hypothetical protein
MGANFKEKGIFDKLVERMHHIINSDNNIANMIDLLQRAVYFALFDKQSETDLLWIKDYLMKIMLNLLKSCGLV